MLPNGCLVYSRIIRDYFFSVKEEYWLNLRVKKYQLPAAHLLCINRKERGRVGFLLVVDFLKIFQSPILRNESRKGSSSSPSMNISPIYLWVCPWSEMYLIADPVISFPSPVLPVIL